MERFYQPSNYLISQKALSYMFDWVLNTSMHQSNSLDYCGRRTHEDKRSHEKI